MHTRKIIHIDMDCFYAAIEVRERPELAGRPVAVGGGSRRGVVTTCNYEARAYRVHSAMPGFLARQRCPHLVFLPVRFDLYRAESTAIRQILREYSPLVEPLSLDEAYLDVTHHDQYAWSLAREIRRRIRKSTGLTASAGVAPNKMLAKIASDWNKPDGQFAVTPAEIEAFMAALPVRKIWGVGPKGAEKLEAMGIENCGQLQAVDRAELVRQFGRWGDELFHLCRGQDDRPVVPNRPRKSLSTERTYGEFLRTPEACRAAMSELVAELAQDLARKRPDRPIHKAFVKVKFSDFSQTTRECVADAPGPGTYQTILKEALTRSDLPVRLLGAGVRFVEPCDTPRQVQPELGL